MRRLRRAPSESGGKHASRASPSLVTPRTLAREQAHRRVLLIGIASLTLLSLSPVFGHHVATGAEALLRGTDQIGQLCLIALHLLLAPVHWGFHIAVALGLAFAVWDRIRASRSSRHTLGQLEARIPLPDEPIARSARAVGISPALIRIVDGLPNPAFTAGWLRPRIYVAGELVRLLDDAELRAVLAHEGAHVARRDPLRLAVLRFFAYTLFWLPALRRLAADVADEAEVQADDQAAREDPLKLASAIVTMAQLSHLRTSPVGVSAFAAATPHDLLERRVRRLTGEELPSGTHVTRRSLAGAAAMLALVWTSGAIMAHPLRAEDSAAVSAQGAETTASAMSTSGGRQRLFLAHLRCATLWLTGAHADCPQKRAHVHS